MEEIEKKTIVSCSGASNTGKYSDEVARRIMKNNQAKMLCLARFSIDNDFVRIIKKDLSNLIVIDGCPVNCAENIMKKSNVNEYAHINITDFNIKKGETPVEEEKIIEIIKYLDTL